MALGLRIMEPGCWLIKIWLRDCALSPEVSILLWELCEWEGVPNFYWGKISSVVSSSWMVELRYLVSTLSVTARWRSWHFKSRQQKYLISAWWFLNLLTYHWQLTDRCQYRSYLGHQTGYFALHLAQLDLDWWFLLAWRVEVLANQVSTIN